VARFDVLQNLEDPTKFVLVEVCGSVYWPARLRLALTNARQGRGGCILILMPIVARFRQVYSNADAPAAHKETAHYARWRDSVADMMAEPRSAHKYSNCFPFQVFRFYFSTQYRRSCIVAGGF
jgi:quinol monooxygenase YgiN